jgi:segregation and condensation protein A
MGPPYHHGKTQRAQLRRDFQASAIITGVNLQVAAHQVEGYRVNTTVYEGPLDLLLQLIERAELDITTLALAQVTDQYLAHMRSLQEQDVAEVSGFLVIAARLLQIKSAALLPRPSLDAKPEDEEDSGEALARQLILYKRFKELAAVLTQRDAEDLRTYLRVAPPPVKVEAKLDMANLTLVDLVMAAQEIFGGKPNLTALSRVVSMPRVTIREKIRAIVDSMRSIGRTTFRQFLKARGDRLEIVVTFLAMLELIKRRVVEVTQPDLFGEIELNPTGDWDNLEDSQLEFIE